MNWLAHAMLSPPDVEVRLGNLLADVVKGRERAAMPVGFLAGVRLHQAIDLFTDMHPIVHRSRGRIGDDFRRVSGILVDVFYDHFLAVDFARYAAEPLDAFTARVYAEMRSHPIELPGLAREVLDRIIADDRLGSYRTIEGIETSLRLLSWRLKERFGRDLQLDRGVAELIEHFSGLRGDFEEFFPQLQGYVAPISPHRAIGQDARMTYNHSSTGASDAINDF